MDKKCTVLFEMLVGPGVEMPRFFTGQTVSVRQIAASEKDLTYLVHIGAVALVEEGKSK